MGDEVTPSTRFWSPALSAACQVAARNPRVAKKLMKRNNHVAILVSVPAIQVAARNVRVAKPSMKRNNQEEILVGLRPFHRRGREIP
jgi:hypothetical protein